jgi:hypothetical protein
MAASAESRLETGVKVETVRTTIELPKVLDRNFEVYCAILGLQKRDVLEELIKERLIDNNMEPYKFPSLKIISSIKYV